ncbi:hypothetical protein CR513_36009, partial [Mucuna pruriens]
MSRLVRPHPTTVQGASCRSIGLLARSVCSLAGFPDTGRMRSAPLENSLRGIGDELQEETMIVSRIYLEAAARVSRDLEVEPPIGEH